MAAKSSGRTRKQTTPSSLLYTLLAVTLVGGAAYYLVNGFENAFNKVNESETKRLAAQPKISPAPLVSRAESDRERAEPFKNAIANNPNIAASQKRNEEIKQLMRTANQVQK